MARNEQAKATIYLDGKQAEAALDGLANRAKSLRAELKKAQEAGDTIKTKKLQSEIKGVESAQRSLRKETFDYEKVLRDINGASMSDLKKSLRTVEVQLNKMKRTDPGYLQKEKEAKQFRNEINKINTGLREQPSFANRAAQGFNKYFGMATAAIASFTGIAFTIKSSIKAFAEFDDKVSDVMKTTGLTKDQVMSLNKELEKIDTRTSQQNLLDLARVAGKLGITAEKDVLGFVRAADKIKVALSEDLGGDVEESINQLGKLVDIFKLQDQFGIEDSLLKVGSAINSLGAAGTANEAYMVEFSKRVAGIAPSAGISIQQVLGLAATLDELGQTSEVSGTTYAKVISSMFTKTGNYAKIAKMEVAEFTQLLNTDANEAFIKVLEGAKGTGDGFAEMASNLGELGLDGARSTAVLSTLGNNIDKLREKQAYSNAEFVKGTSIQKEFDTKKQNAQAGLEKARKSFEKMQRELGERLAPAYASVIHKSSALLKILGTTIEFLFDNRKALITAAVAIGSYTVAVNAATWATKAYNAITTAATAITKAFNTAVKTNWVGLIISLLTTAATAFYLFSQKADIAKKSQKEFNDEIERGNELLGQSKTLEERASVIKNLSKTQLENLKSDLQAQLNAEDDFHATLLQKAKKKVTEDAELQRIAELRKQKDLTDIQKINLAAQEHARKIAITRDLETENKSNQERLKNLKKHLANVNTELKTRPSEFSGTETAAPTNNETADKALEIANAQRILALKEQYGAEESMQLFFQARLLGNELMYLQAKANLEIDESKKLALQIQIVDVQNKYNKAIKDSVDALRLKEKAVETVNTKLLEESKLTQRNAQIAKQAAAEQEDLNDKLTSQAKLYQDTITVVSDSLFDMMSGSEDAFKTFAKNILIFALEQLKVQAQIAAAGATVQSLASPESIATFGVAGLAKAALIVGLIEAAFAGVEGLVNNAFSSKKGKSMADGGGVGYTGPGSKYEKKQLVQLHAEEYVVPKEGTQNPQIRPVLDIIEIARRNGSLARLDLRQIVQAIPARSFSGGGFASNGAAAVSLPPQGGVPAGGGGLPDLTDLIRQSIRSNNELKAAADALRKEGTYTRLLGRNGFIETEANYQKMKTDITLK